MDWNRAIKRDQILRQKQFFFYIFFGNIEFKARKIIYNAIHYTMFDLNVCGVSVFALKSRMKQLIKQHKSTSHRVIFLYFSSFSSDILHLNAFQTHTHPHLSHQISLHFVSCALIHIILCLLYLFCKTFGMMVCGLHFMCLYNENSKCFTLFSNLSLFCPFNVHCIFTKMEKKSVFHSVCVIFNHNIKLLFASSLRFYAICLTKSYAYFFSLSLSQTKKNTL